VTRNPSGTNYNTAWEENEGVEISQANIKGAKGGGNPLFREREGGIMDVMDKSRHER